MERVERYEAAAIFLILRGDDRLERAKAGGRPEMPTASTTRVFSRNLGNFIGANTFARF